MARRRRSRPLDDLFGMPEPPSRRRFEGKPRCGHHRSGKTGQCTRERGHRGQHVTVSGKRWAAS